MGTYAKAFHLTFRCGHVSFRLLCVSHKEVGRRIAAALQAECFACECRADRARRAADPKHQAFVARINRALAADAAMTDEQFSASFGGAPA